MATPSPWYVILPIRRFENCADRHKLGYGTGTAWYKTGDESKLDQACIDSLKTAIKLGYHHLDGAEGEQPCPPEWSKMRGLTRTKRTRLNQSLDRPSSMFLTRLFPCLASTGTDISLRESGVERSKLFVTTKVLPNIADIPAALKSSLKKLQLDYVDLCVLAPSSYAKLD